MLVLRFEAEQVLEAYLIREEQREREAPLPSEYSPPRPTRCPGECGRLGVLVLVGGGRRQARMIVSADAPILTPFPAPGSARTLELLVTGPDVGTQQVQRDSRRPRGCE
jgi:hypothetical protein